MNLKWKHFPDVINITPTIWKALLYLFQHILMQFITHIARDGLKLGSSRSISSRLFSYSYIVRPGYQLMLTEIPEVLAIALFQ